MTLLAYSWHYGAYSLAEGTVQISDSNPVRKGLGQYRRDINALSEDGVPQAGSGKSWQR